MSKKTSIVLVFAMVMISIYPSVCMSSWYAHPPSYNHYYHYGHVDKDLFLGLTALFLGTALLSTFLHQPPQQKVPLTYVAPKTRIYTYPPVVPPGMCRWERYILDNYGRMVIDQYGKPVKEYTLGSCQYPPN